MEDINLSPEFRIGRHSGERRALPETERAENRQSL
jgi:hypothetical protein